MSTLAALTSTLLLVAVSLARRVADSDPSSSLTVVRWGDPTVVRWIDPGVVRSLDPTVVYSLARDTLALANLLYAAVYRRVFVEPIPT